MEHEVFEVPVGVFVGLSYRHEVATVAQAYSFLSEWPALQRSPAHRAAMNACRAAMSGKVDAETARAAFVDFARRSGILVPEVEKLAAAKAANTRPRHTYPEAPPQ